jgi:S1-C subfamily serine protease
MAGEWSGRIARVAAAWVWLAAPMPAGASPAPSVRLIACPADAGAAVAVPPARIVDAMASVVAIEAEGPVARAPTDLTGRSLGSGVIVAADGLLLTNAHVIGGRTTIMARLRDGRRLPARVLGADIRVDLALARVEPAALPREGLRPMAFALGRAARVGEPAVALGNPMHFAFSATRGIVSGSDRAYDEAWPVDFLQHDAALNPGNSGGPLIDAQGCALGINTATPAETLFDIGLGLAIPADLVAQIVPQLAAEGFFPRGLLGLMASAAGPEVAAALGAPGETGVLVDAVIAGSAADLAGLAAGDLLTHVEGRPVGMPRDVSRALLSRRSGERVTARLVRGGAVRLVEATLQAEPRPAVFAADAAAATAPRELAPEALGVEIDEAGPAIARVAAGGRADGAGLRTGDVIVAVNGVNARDAAHVRALWRAARGAHVLLRVTRADMGARHVLIEGVARADAGAALKKTAGGATMPPASIAEVTVRAPHGPL